MYGVAFELPIDDPEEIFDLYWNALKRSIRDRNAIPPKAALLLSGSQVELLNIREIGGFSELTNYILGRSDGPLRACIVSFEIVDRDTCDGKLIAVLFPGNNKKPLIKVATWMLVGSTIYCEDQSSGYFSDYDFEEEELSGLVCPLIGYA